MLFFNAEKITASFQKHYFKFVCVGVEFCKTVIWKKKHFCTQSFNWIVPLKLFINDTKLSNKVKYEQILCS
jgi:hypothetical protein